MYIAITLTNSREIKQDQTGSNRIKQDQARSNMINQRNDNHKLQALLAETEHEVPRWGWVHAVTGRGGGLRDVF